MTEIETQGITPGQTESFPVPTKSFSVTGEPIESEAPLSEQQEKANFLQLARERFKMAEDAWNRAYTEMREDQNFKVGIDQWDPKVKTSRTKVDFGRPCLMINRIPGFVGHVVNNMRQSRPAIKIDPAGDGADQRQAEIREGLVRHIQVNSQAAVAYDYGFEAMCTGGLGFIRIVDDFADTMSMDRELLIRWVSNIFSIYTDPTAQMPDWSDMQFAFVVDAYTRGEFKERFGEKDLYGDDIAATGDAPFKAIGDYGPSWFPDGKIRVAEYYYIEHEKDTLVELSDGRTELFSKLEMPLPEGISIVRQRETTTPQVWWCLITGTNVLQKRKWPGPWIPIIPIIGSQTDVDGERLIHGMVRFLREPQRMYNYMYSTMVETVALSPRNQWIAESRQLEGFEAIYQSANVDPIAVLPYHMVVDETHGVAAPPPQRQSAAADISTFVNGIQVCDQQLKAISGIYDAALGQRGPQESALAINARKVESDTGTYNWGDNFIRALEYTGRQLNALLKHYYNQPGRLVQILREDGSQESVLMNQAHEDPKNPGQMVKNDLTSGRYSTVVSTGPDYATRRKEASASILEASKIYAPIMQVGADVWLEEQDWAGAQKLAARVKKTMPPALQDDDPNQPQIPPQIAAQMTQMQQLVQNLSQALEQATDKNLQQKTKEEWQTFRDTMKNETNITVAEIQVKQEQSMLLAQKTFEHMERLMAKLEGQVDPNAPSASSAPQPQAPVTVSGGGLPPQ